jgi:DNA-directed RNA polymerase subunit RPC12/RpoP
MISCIKCKSRMFIDRQYSSPMHLEVYCLYCGSRRFLNPPESTAEGRWLLKKEQLRAKATISSL